LIFPALIAYDSKKYKRKRTKLRFAMLMWKGSGFGIGLNWGVEPGDVGLKFPADLVCCLLPFLRLEVKLLKDDALESE
jgi:hypothetical protein